MSTSRIHPDLKPLRFIRPILWRPLLPFMNATLSVLPHPMGKETKVDRHIIPVRAGRTILATIIAPNDLNHPSPCLVFYHGGAFMLKAAPHHYSLAKQFALRARCVVVLPDYRLAPRHPFPEPAEDCYAVYEWTIGHAAALGIHPGHIAIGGDSAGGNLAASVCLMARDRHIPLPCMQTLLYPALDRRMDSRWMRTHAKTPMWNARLNRRMWKTYLPDNAAPHIQYASPIEAPSLAGLPNTYLETAELDPLRDEGIAYAEALRIAGVHVQLVQVSGAFHGFDLMKNSSLVKQCMNDRIEALMQAFTS